MSIKHIPGLFLLMFLTSVCFVCCDAIEPEIPPYIISKPESKIGTLPGYYQFAGVEFDFFNATTKDISGINISFMVYDSITKKNPLIGSNIISSSYSGGLLRNTSKKMIICLDKYMYVAPDEPYLIDFFYISKISYSDGSQWEDSNGTYFTRSY